MERVVNAKRHRIFCCKKFLKLTAVLLIAAAVFVLFTAAAQSESEKIIKQLICERTDTMNEYFDGGTSYKEACVNLTSIEKGKLLADDIESLRSYFATDIEEVKSYKISEIEVNYEDEDVICAFVGMEWEIKCVDELYRHSDTAKIEAGYSVIAEQCDGAFKLVQLR